LVIAVSVVCGSSSWQFQTPKGLADGAGHVNHLTVSNASDFLTGSEIARPDEESGGFAAA